jgi:CRISPR-associated protein Csx3
MIASTIIELDGGATLVKFDLSSVGGIVAPEDLEQYLGGAPAVDATRGVVISCKGPNWLNASFAHHYHATPFVAMYDPRFRGGVVVQRHSATAPKLGEIVPVPPELI